MSRTLIIGANSFLAQALAAELQEPASGELAGVYHRKQDRIVAAHYETLLPADGDWRDLADVERVAFCAGYIPHGRMNERSDRWNELNAGLLHEALRSFPEARFVFCSSVAVYGQPVELPLTEHSPLAETTRYGLSKRVGEGLVANHARGASVRFSSLYGKGVAEDTILPKWIRAAREEGVLTVFGDGRRRQDYLHVRDAARCLVAAMNCPGEGPFLGVSGHAVSNLELANTIKELQPGTRIEFQGADESPSFDYDNSRTVEALGWQAATSLKDGLAEMVA